MKESENLKGTSSLIWSYLVLSAECVGYVLLNQWQLLVGGIIGFALIFILKK